MSEEKRNWIDYTPTKKVVVGTDEDGVTFIALKFRWNVNKSQAAVDIASGMSLKETAKRAKTNTYQLHQWLKHPEFKARLEEHRKAAAEVASQTFLGQKHARMQKLAEDYEKTDQALAGMAEVAKRREIPGAESGLIRYKENKFGTEIRPDTSLIAERREILKHIAIEKGEWQENSGGGNVAVQIVVPSVPAVPETSVVTIGRQK
jgi:hypothetical protein